MSQRLPATVLDDRQIKSRWDGGSSANARRLWVKRRSAESSGSYVAVFRQPAALRESAAPGARRRPQELWRLSQAAIASNGAPGLGSSALAAVGLRRLEVYRLRKDEVVAAGESMPGVTVSLLGSQQVAAYLQLRPDTPRSEVVRRLHGGAVCIGAWRDGRLVAARWIETGCVEIAYLGIAVSVYPSVWYAHDAYTTAAERRRGLSATVTGLMVQHAVGQGATSIIHAVLPENRGGRALASRRSQRLGVLRSLAWGQWRVVGCSLPPGYLQVPGPPGGHPRAG